MYLHGGVTEQSKNKLHRKSDVKIHACRSAANYVDYHWRYYHHWDCRAGKKSFVSPLNTFHNTLALNFCVMITEEHST